MVAKCSCSKSIVFYCSFYKYLLTFPWKEVLSRAPHPYMYVCMHVCLSVSIFPVFLSNTVSIILVMLANNTYVFLQWVSLLEFSQSKRVQAYWVSWWPQDSVCKNWIAQGFWERWWICAGLLPMAGCGGQQAGWRNCLGWDTTHLRIWVAGMCIPMTKGLTVGDRDVYPHILGTRHPVLQNLRTWQQWQCRGQRHCQPLSRGLSGRREPDRGRTCS